jgi:hypothetical protein
LIHLTPIFFGISVSSRASQRRRWSKRHVALSCILRQWRRDPDKEKEWSPRTVKNWHASRLLRCTLCFRDGSKTEVSGLARHVRVTLRSRHCQPATACPFGAKPGSSRIYLLYLFPHQSLDAHLSIADKRRRARRVINRSPSILTSLICVVPVHTSFAEMSM